MGLFDTVGGAYGYQTRRPYDSEKKYFKDNPNVAGMAAEDGKIVLNPYSKNTPQQQQSVVQNEAIRLWLRKNNFNPQFDVTPKQAAAFANTDYGKPENIRHLKHSLIARYLSGDPSSGQLTPEQVKAADTVRANLPQTGKQTGLFDVGYSDLNRGIWDFPRREEQRGSAMGEPRARMLQVLGLLGTPFPTSDELGTSALYRAGKLDAMAGGPTPGQFREGVSDKTKDLALNLFGIFKGVKGANKAQKQALVTAQKMAKEGADRDEIWNATLWYKGNDGKWRTEIDDSTVPVKKVLTEDTLWGYPNALDVFPHKELARSYPDMGALKLGPEYGDSLGSYNARQGVVTMKPVTDAENFQNASKQRKTVALHELQHAVQQREGFARGGSPDQFLLDDSFKPMQRSAELAQAKGLEWDKLSKDQRRAITNELINEQYRRLAGETEARNVQARMDMTMDQRRQFPPWSTWDVPEADQIVRMEGGPAMMVQPKRLEQGLLGEPGYVYHATNDERLRDILASGKLKTHKPGDFTDQDMWPDGTVEKRAYFGKSPENLWQFAPEEGTPVVLRTKHNPETFKRESTGDIFTKKPVSAKDIEFLGDDGKWHSLKELTSEP